LQFPHFNYQVNIDGKRREQAKRRQNKDSYHGIYNRSFSDF